MNEDLRTCAELQTENEALRRERDNLKRQLDEIKPVEVIRIHYEHGQANVVMQHPAIVYLAQEMAGLFDEAGGVNYVEAIVRHEPLDRTFILTLQNKDGLTPHQLRQQI